MFYKLFNDGEKLEMIFSIFNTMIFKWLYCLKFPRKFFTAFFKTSEVWKYSYFKVYNILTL